MALAAYRGIARRMYCEAFLCIRSHRNGGGRGCTLADGGVQPVTRISPAAHTDVYVGLLDAGNERTAAGAAGRLADCAARGLDAPYRLRTDAGLGGCRPNTEQRCDPRAVGPAGGRGEYSRARSGRAEPKCAAAFELGVTGDTRRIARDQRIERSDNALLNARILSMPPPVFGDRYPLQAAIFKMEPHCSAPATILAVNPRNPATFGGVHRRSVISIFLQIGGYQKQRGSLKVPQTGAFRAFGGLSGVPKN